MGWEGVCKLVCGVGGVGPSGNVWWVGLHGMVIIRKLSNVVEIATNSREKAKSEMNSVHVEVAVCDTPKNEVVKAQTNVNIHKTNRTHV